MGRFGREYDFDGREYYFKVNKELISKYKLNRVEQFIIQNEMQNVESIKVKLQNEFDINNLSSHFVIWDELHKLYTEDIIEWHKDNPFEDMYEYNSGNIKFKVDVSLNKDYKKYSSGVVSALAKGFKNYEKNINKISQEPLTNLIYVSISNNDEIIGIITFLLGIDKKSYIIGNIELKGDISDTDLNNAFVWSASRLCLIFGYICNSFEFRIEEEKLDRYEVRRLRECGFKAQKIIYSDQEVVLLKKNI
ncbi:MAG: hypothetical protein E7213_04465 [Clostridium sp.]|nr:hypothetical protein [Clostridium sp.]